MEPMIRLNERSGPLFFDQRRHTSGLKAPSSLLNTFKNVSFKKGRNISSKSVSLVANEQKSRIQVEKSKTKNEIKLLKEEKEFYIKSAYQFLGAIHKLNKKIVNKRVVHL